MSDLRRRLIQLLENPRVSRILQDPRTQKALIEGLRLRGRAQEEIDRRLAHLAGRLNLATQRDLRDLKRAIRRLEDELAAQRDDPGS